MKNLINSFLILCIILLLGCSSKEGIKLYSPDNNIFICISEKGNENLPNNNQLVYSVQFRGDYVLDECTFGLEFKNMQPFGGGVEIIERENNQVRTKWERVWGKNEKANDNYNEMVLTLN